MRQRRVVGRPGVVCGLGGVREVWGDVRGVCGCGGRLGRSINEVLPGFEPGSLDSESRVLTITP